LLLTARDAPVENRRVRYRYVADATNNRVWILDRQTRRSALAVVEAVA
jgi:hypothetical protein